MAAAYAAHPERFIRAIPRPPALPTAVQISVRRTAAEPPREPASVIPGEPFLPVEA
jgi:hypothetical protein